MRPAFTLVHGTWADKAPWAQADSRLARGLRERFGADTPIESFNWGGWNRVGTRSRGARALAQHLREAPLAEDQRRFVIAHSHGGNVALYALRDEAAAARTAGVATLATPFLVASRRLYSARLEAARITLLAVVGLLLLALAGATADGLSAGRPAALGWGLFVLIAGLLLWGLARLARAWDRFADRVVAAMAFGPIARERLLVLRSPGDEASILLLSARVLLAIGMVGLGALARLCAALEAALQRSRQQPRYGWLLGLGTLLGWVLLLALAALLLPLQPTVAVWLLLAVAVLALLLLVPLAMNALGDGNPDAALLSWHYLLGAMLLATVMLPSLLLVFYGWQLAAANLEVDVSAEATPPGEWQVVTLLGSQRFGAAGTAALTHSALYDDERALQRIGDWVQQLLQAEAAHEKQAPQRLFQA